MPFPVTMEVLKRGQERFNIYCTPCHSRVGNGLGEIVQRGYKPAANLHDQVRLSQPISHYFYVMTHGYGAMPDYSAQLPPADRWAVAAYIRALQLSQAATAQDVPAGVQIKRPEGHGRRRRASRDTRSRGRCRRRRCRRTSRSPARERRPWLRLIRRTRRLRFQTGSEANRPTGGHRSKDRTKEWTTRMDNHDIAREDASRRSGRAGLCRRLEDARAHDRGGLRRDRRDSGVPGPGAGWPGLGSPAARLDAGHHAHFGSVRRRAGAADGAVLLGRQVGTAAAPAA